MPARKTKAQVASAAPANKQPAASPEAEPFFPFARYTSIVGVHTSLLAFSALILPTTPTALLSKGLAGLQTGARPRRDVLEILTENPTRTVAWICAGTLLLQGWWAGWVKAWSDEQRKPRDAPTDSAQATQKKLERKESGNQRNTVLAKAVAATLAASAALHVVVVLFGAPLMKHPLHTYLLSLLLAILTVFPPAYTLDLPSLGSDNRSLVSWFTWIRLFAELSPRTPVERALVYPAVGAVTGCWAGAIPIGLDWERPWQAWPLTPAFGAVGGYIVGSLVALVTSATFALAQVDREAQLQAAEAAGAKKPKSS